MDLVGRKILAKSAFIGEDREGTILEFKYQDNENKTYISLNIKVSFKEKYGVLGREVEFFMTDGEVVDFQDGKIAKTITGLNLIQLLQKETSEEEINASIWYDTVDLKELDRVVELLGFKPYKFKGPKEEYPKGFNSLPEELRNNIIGYVSKLEKSAEEEYSELGEHYQNWQGAKNYFSEDEINDLVNILSNNNFPNTSDLLNKLKELLK